MLVAKKDILRAVEKLESVCKSIRFNSETGEENDAEKVNEEDMELYYACWIALEVMKGCGVIPQTSPVEVKARDEE